MRKTYVFGLTPSPNDHDRDRVKALLENGEVEERDKFDGVLTEANDELNEIEKEAFELYQWSQELSFEDIG